MSPTIGRHSLSVIAVSDSYIGFEFREEVFINVVQEVEKGKYHEDDLRNEPNFIERALRELNQPGENSDEDEVDENENVIKPGNDSDEEEESD